jgi:uroporphyrinogen III methyltransferase/synthase
MLLPRAAIARDILPAGLRRRGAVVDVVEAYRTVIPPEAAASARKLFGDPHKPGWITFTSSSTVKNLLRVVSPEDLAGVKVASIGPVTSNTARHLGLEVRVEAAEYTVDGLVRALINATQPPARP